MDGADDSEVYIVGLKDFSGDSGVRHSWYAIIIPPPFIKATQKSQINMVPTPAATWTRS